MFGELRRKINNSGVTYPRDLMENINKYPDRTVLPSPVMVGDILVPGIFFVCPESDIDYFKIKSSHPEPDIKYRYLTMEHLSVIEIILRFANDRQLVLHLNPSASSVKQFLSNCITSEIISFHFICMTRNILASSFTDIDDEQREWLERNYKRSVSLSKLPDSVFSLASEGLAAAFKDNQKYYKFCGKKRYR